MPLVLLQVDRLVVDAGEGEIVGRGHVNLLVVTLLEPGIAVIVVAAHFPEARLVEHRELDALDPLGALPEIELRDHDAQRPAMFPADRLAVPAPGQQHVVGGEIRQRHVGLVGVVGVEDDVLHVGLGLHQVDQGARGNALPHIVVARPGGDAVDVGGQRDLGQIGELPPLQVIGFSTSPSTNRRQACSGISGWMPRSSTGQFSTRRWPGGRRSHGAAVLPVSSRPSARPLLLAVDQLVLELAGQGDARRRAS